MDFGFPEMMFPRHSASSFQSPYYPRYHETSPHHYGHPAMRGGVFVEDPFDSRSAAHYQAQQRRQAELRHSAELRRQEELRKEEARRQAHAVALQQAQMRKREEYLAQMRAQQEYLAQIEGQKKQQQVQLLQKQKDALNAAIQQQRKQQQHWSESLSDSDSDESMPELEPIFEGVFANSPSHPATPDAGFEPAAPPTGAASPKESPKESPKTSPKTSPKKTRSPRKATPPRRTQSPQKMQPSAPVAVKVISVTDATAAIEANDAVKATPSASAPTPAPATLAPSAPAAPAAEEPSPNVTAVSSPTSGMSDEQAAVVIQSAWRGHQVRSTKPFEVAKPIVELRKLLREMEERLEDKEFVAKVVTEPMEKLRMTETIMCWLFRLDGVQSTNQEVRALRRDMARKLNQLLDQVDALTLPAPDEGENDSTK